MNDKYMNFNVCVNQIHSLDTQTTLEVHRKFLLGSVSTDKFRVLSLSLNPCKRFVSHTMRSHDRSL